MQEMYQNTGSRHEVKSTESFTSQLEAQSDYRVQNAVPEYYSADLVAVRQTRCKIFVFCI